MSHSFTNPRILRRAAIVPKDQEKSLEDLPWNNSASRLVTGRRYEGINLPASALENIVRQWKQKQKQEAAKSAAATERNTTTSASASTSAPGPEPSPTSTSKSAPAPAPASTPDPKPIPAPKPVKTPIPAPAPAPAPEPRPSTLNATESAEESAGEEVPWSPSPESHKYPPKKQPSKVAQNQQSPSPSSSPLLSQPQSANKPPPSSQKTRHVPPPSSLTQKYAQRRMSGSRLLIDGPESSPAPEISVAVPQGMPTRTQSQILPPPSDHYSSSPARSPAKNATQQSIPSISQRFLPPSQDSSLSSSPELTPNYNLTLEPSANEQNTITSTTDSFGRRHQNLLLKSQYFVATTPPLAAQPPPPDSPFSPSRPSSAAKQTATSTTEMTKGHGQGRSGRMNIPQFTQTQANNILPEPAQIPAKRSHLAPTTSARFMLKEQPTQDSDSDSDSGSSAIPAQELIIRARKLSTTDSGLRHARSLSRATHKDLPEPRRGAPTRAAMDSQISHVSSSPRANRTRRVREDSLELTSELPSRSQPRSSPRGRLSIPERFAPEEAEARFKKRSSLYLEERPEAPVHIDTPENHKTAARTRSHENSLVLSADRIPNSQRSHRSNHIQPPSQERVIIAPRAQSMTDYKPRPGYSPYDWFCGVYPDYTATPAAFSNGIQYLAYLRRGKRLPECLYDDMLRAFTTDYAAYVVRTRNPSPAVAWYMDRLDTPQYQARAITQANLDAVHLATLGYTPEASRPRTATSAAAAMHSEERPSSSPPVRKRRRLESSPAIYEDSMSPPPMAPAIAAQSAAAVAAAAAHESSRLSRGSGSHHAKHSSSILRHKAAGGEVYADEAPVIPSSPLLLPQRNERVLEETSERSEPVEADDDENEENHSPRPLPPAAAAATAAQAKGKTVLGRISGNQVAPARPAGILKNMTRLPAPPKDKGKQRAVEPQQDEESEPEEPQVEVVDHEELDESEQQQQQIDERQALRDQAGEKKKKKRKRRSSCGFDWSVIDESSFLA